MNILYINSSVSPDSRTERLAQYALSKLEGDVIELNLEDEKISSLYCDILQKRFKLVKENDFADPIFKYAKQFVNADIILIGAPLWDLSFPSFLKIYIEAINIPNLTFKYSQSGEPISLCKAKRLIYITTSGGPIISEEYGFGYIKALAQIYYGIKEVTLIKAENLDIIGANVEEILQKAEKDIDAKI